VGTVTAACRSGRLFLSFAVGSIKGVLVGRGNVGGVSLAPAMLLLRPTPLRHAGCSGGAENEDKEHSALRYSLMSGATFPLRSRQRRGRELARNFRPCSRLIPKTKGSTMTYVASPSHPLGDLARIEDLKQCLDTARKHMNETSKSSDAEKQAELIVSAVDAGWEEGEVRLAIAAATNDRTDGDVFLTPTLGVVPSSSM